MAARRGTASLPLGNVLETPPGQVPVVLAHKMNGQVIPAAQGGPVRVVVPGTYGNKSIRWVQRIVLTNDYRANDSDASDFNSDTDTPFKTKARFVAVRSEASARALARRRPVLDQGRLAGCGDPPTACILERRSAGR